MADITPERRREPDPTWYSDLKVRELLDALDEVKAERGRLAGLLERCETTLQAIKLRIHFVGLPSEPHDWAPEIRALECSLAEAREAGRGV